MASQHRAAPSGAKQSEVVSPLIGTTGAVLLWDTRQCQLAGKTPSAFTSVAVEKSSSKIAWYVFCCLPHNACPKTLVVGRLKVDAEYQRRRVGTMLLAVGDLNAKQHGWRCSNARLSVLAENRLARNCYVQAGCKQFRALMSGLPKALAMKYRGCGCHGQTGASLVK